jgi:hypothetical protein
MAQVCNGICHRYQANTKCRFLGMSIYLVGIYKCSVCQIHMTVNGVVFKPERKSITCICCKNKIRMKPRFKKKMENKIIG